MINVIEKRFALSRRGSLGFLKAILYTSLQNLIFMLPASYMILYLKDYLRSSIENDFPYYLLMGVTFMVLMFAITLIQYRSTFITVYQESADRRISLAEKIRLLPISFFGERNLSDLTSTIMQDCTDLEYTFSHAVPQLFSSLISTSIISILLFAYNWKMALSLFWVIPTAFLLIYLSKEKQYKSNKEVYSEKRKVSERIQEGIEMISEIKSYNQEASYLEQLNQEIDNYEKQLIRGEILSGALVNIAQSFLKLGIASLILVGASLSLRGEIDVFEYLVFMLVSSRVYIPIQQTLNSLLALFYLDVRIGRINEIQELSTQTGKLEFAPKSFDIEFSDVDFSYKEDQKILEKISFTANQGEITAIVGPSGGGKSTLIKLVSRFWDTDQGEIFLGNQDIAKVDPEKLLENYSTVFQDVTLFNTSIIENIRIGKNGASDEEVLRASKMAHCDEFIQRLPQKYNTIIGENGARLSGGERQRISIARALLKDAPIILLDEATSALDAESESRVQLGIAKLVKGKTALIVAHRLRTVARADKIIVLEGGTIVEEGTHDKLISNRGTYAKLWEAQAYN